MLEQVHHDADRVTRLITELLDISRLETGRAWCCAANWSTCRRWQATVIEKLAVLNPPSSSCTVVVRRRLPPGLRRPPTSSSRSSPTSSRTPPSTARPRAWPLPASTPTGDVSVAVTDQGEGIPAVDLPRVFRKFFRARPRQAHRHRARPLDQPGPGRGPRRRGSPRCRPRGGGDVPLHPAVGRRRRPRCRSWPATPQRFADRSRRPNTNLRFMLDSDQRPRRDRRRPVAGAAASLDELSAVESSCWRRAQLSGFRASARRARARRAKDRRAGRQRRPRRPRVAAAASDASWAPGPGPSRSPPSGSTSPRSPADRRRSGTSTSCTQAMEHLEDVFVGLGFTGGRGPRGRDRLEQLRRRSTSRPATRRGTCTTRSTSTTASRGIDAAAHPHLAGPGAGDELAAAAASTR